MKAYIFVAIVMAGSGASLVSGALNCKKPNNDTEFCVDLTEKYVSQCTGACSGGPMTVIPIERLQFPDGTDNSATGVTTEERHDCWRLLNCVYDVDLQECVSQDNSGNSWNKADKTVVNSEAVCPEEAS
jgi:hypothetical protein